MSLTATKMFLERSEPLLISVSVELIRLHESPKLLPLLVGAAHRWKTFEMDYDEAEYVLAALPRIPHGSLKHLEKLQLTFSNLHSELNGFQSAPRLRDVTLELLNTSYIIPMPWDQLTRLSLNYDSPQSCLDILVCCTNIVSASFVTEQWLESDIPDVAGTSLLVYMEELEIYMFVRSTGEHFGPFLLRLELPALKSLTLTLTLSRPINYEWSISSSIPAMSTCLSRSPNLECLRVEGFLSVEDLRNVLSYSPILTELSFSAPVNDEFFAALSHSETDAAPLVPKLETLHLIDIGADFSEQSMAEMIQSRWWSEDELLAMPAPPGVARLKRVSLRHDRIVRKHFTEALKREMQRYCSQGLKLEGFKIHT